MERGSWGGAINVTDMRGDRLKAAAFDDLHWDGQHAGEQLIEDDTQGEDVRPCIQILRSGGGLLWAHIRVGGAGCSAELGGEKWIAQPFVGCVQGLGYAEIDHLRHRLAVLHGHQDV